MTMPHLMNCRHSESGWCLDCVKELHSRAKADAARMDFLATCNQTWPSEETIRDREGKCVTDIYEWLAEFDVSDAPPNAEDMKNAFRMMVDVAICARSKRDFEDHLEWAECNVAAWPDWKKRVLGFWSELDLSEEE